MVKIGDKVWIKKIVREVNGRTVKVEGELPSYGPDMYIPDSKIRRKPRPVAPPP